MADATFSEHPQLGALTLGQQQLARRIVNAGLGTADEVIRAFATRQNGAIGRWKALLDGNPTRVPPPRQDDRSGPNPGAARSPWNMGHAHR